MDISESCPAHSLRDHFLGLKLLTTGSHWIASKRKSHGWSMPNLRRRRAVRIGVARACNLLSCAVETDPGSALSSLDLRTGLLFSGSRSNVLSRYVTSFS